MSVCRALPSWAALVAILALGVVRAEEQSLLESVKQLCAAYWEGFGCADTNLCYHHRINGPRGIGTLSSPEDIARRVVNGKPMPYGYGSGIQDVALENGQLLFALCDAYDAIDDEDLAAMARRVFQGLKLVGTVSPVPGFVPRGPHPDGKSYYPDSSRDQTCAFVEAMWRYYASPLSTEDDKAFIADVIAKVARRMERHDYILMVEDGSRMAHVGWGWRQYTLIGAATLLSHLASAREVTGDPHWATLHEEFSRENDGVRWKLLSTLTTDTWRPQTLYSNQFFTSLALLARTETDPDRVASLRGLMRAIADRALHSNVFDETQWRRLDWAGQWTEAQTEEALKPFGLTLKQPATVVDLYQRFDPALFGAKSWQQANVNAKLLMGLATVALHEALLSEDPDLVAEVAPHVKDMVHKMLSHGDAYTRGENFNRAVVLGLQLVATLGTR